MQKLNPEDQFNLRNGMEEMTDPINGEGEIISVGALFAGIQLLAHLMKENASAANEIFGTHIRLECLYVAEHDPETLDFLLKNHEIPYAFSEVADLKEFQAREVRTKKLVPIPWVAILVFGFSCKDRSSQNPKASSKLGCTQEATGSTGTGWQDTKGVIVRHRPRKLYAENTRMLDTHTPDHEFYSDSAFIKKDCEDMGYYTEVFIVRSEVHGSFCVRCRWLLYAQEGYDRCLKRTMYIERLLYKMQTPMLDYSAYEIDDFTMMKFRGGPARKKAKLDKGEQYADKHAEAYAKHNVKWPPTQGEMHKELGDIVREMTLRQSECAFLASKIFPTEFAHDRQGDVIHWQDLNCGLDRLMGDNYEKNPWSDRIMTITTKMVLLKRVSKKEVDSSISTNFKIMDGLDLMQMQGWDPTYFVDPSEVPESMLATQFAGNAFNGFQFSAFLIATTAASVIKKEEVTDTEKEENNDGSESDEDGASSG